MNRSRTIRTAIAAIGAMGATAMLAADPAWAPSSTVDTDSEVFAGISLTSDGSALFFGAFEPGPGGTIVVDQSGNGTTFGPVFVPAGNQTTAAGFDVTGEPSYGYHLGGGDATVILTGPGGAQLTASLDKPADGTLTLDVNGQGSFSVGGTLTVGASADQPFGDYVGTFSITVTYD